MVTYKINTDNKTNNLSKLNSPNKQSNTTSTTSTASTAPKQTVQIKNPNTGSNMTVTAGSQTHQNYLKNNPSAIDQSSVTTTYSTPDKYVASDNVKQFDQNGQQTYSTSGYTGATTPTFNVSSNITDMVNQIKNQEALMRQNWSTTDKSGYNDLIKARNEMSGQLLNLITQESGGNASLGEIESILGRRLENQEMQGYREAYSNGSALQQSQLNNTWEHDFATRNNGEAYQYQTNYLTNGTGSEVLSENTLNYLNSMTPEQLAAYTQNIGSSLASTQDYFNQRATGWVPEYVNNTVNPLPWGEVDAGDILNNGGLGMQQQYENYLWMLANPNYDYSTMTPSPIDTGLNQSSPALTSPTINLNMTNPTTSTQNSGIDFTALMNLLNSNQTPTQLTSNQGNLSSQSTQDDLLNQYLMNIWNGGL